MRLALPKKTLQPGETPTRLTVVGTSRIQLGGQENSADRALDVAIAARRLGATVTLITAVTADSHGGELLNRAMVEEVNVSNIVVSSDIWPQLSYADIERAAPSIQRANALCVCGDLQEWSIRALQMARANGILTAYQLDSGDPSKEENSGSADVITAGPEQTAPLVVRLMEGTLPEAAIRFAKALSRLRSRNTYRPASWPSRADVFDELLREHLRNLHVPVVH